MSKQYSSQLADFLIYYVKACDYDYQFKQDSGIIEFDLSIEAKLSKIQRIHFSILIEEYGFIVLGGINLDAQEAVRDEIMEYLNFVNYIADVGCFEFNIATGNFRYKITVDCGNRTISTQLVYHCIFTTYKRYVKYGDHLLRILVGAETAAEAIAQIQEKGEANNNS